MLNVDVMRRIGTFLTLMDYYSARTAHKDFYSPKIARRKRFRWSTQRTKLYGMRQGWCAHNDCCNQRLSCIELEPLTTQILSIYCGQCTIKYKKISTLVLL
jgi:hypothetical protein